MKYLPLLAALLAGCLEEGPKTHTTPAGVPVHVRGDVVEDRVTLYAWVDMRLEEWIEHKTDWGCGEISDDNLRRAAGRYPVVIFPGETLPSGLLGFTTYGDRIDVAVGKIPELHGGMPYDPQYRFCSGDLCHSYGLLALPHEWTHVIRRDWHPE